MQDSASTYFYEVMQDYLVGQHAMSLQEAMVTDMGMGSDAGVAVYNVTVSPAYVSREGGVWVYGIQGREFFLFLQCLEDGVVVCQLFECQEGEAFGSEECKTFTIVYGAKEGHMAPGENIRVMAALAQESVDDEATLLEDFQCQPAFSAGTEYDDRRFLGRGLCAGHMGLANFWSVRVAAFGLVFALVFALFRLYGFQGSDLVICP